MTSWFTDRARIEGNSGILFAEDFDAATNPLEDAPELIEPVFTALDMDDARAAGFRAGREAATAEHAASTQSSSGTAMAVLAGALTDSRARTEQMADEAADALARLMLAMAAAMLPVLCQDHGEAEARAVMRAVLPGLSREPRVTVRAHPATLAALRDETAGMDGELTAMLRFVVHHAMPPGDVRVGWHEGTACREADAIWRDIAGVLAPSGLLGPVDHPALTKETEYA